MKGLLFTYVLTYGGAAAALLDPFKGLLVYVCFAIVKPDAMWPWAVPQGNYSRIVAGAMLAGWLLSGGSDLRFGRSRGVVLALVGFLMWSVLGACAAPQQAVAWGFVEALAKIVLPFVVGITTINSIARARQLAWVIVLSEGYVAFEMNLYYLSGHNVLHESGFAGMDNNSAAIGLVTAFGLTFFLGWHARPLWQKGLALGLALLMGHAVLFSFSRGGMLALAVSGAVAFALMPKQPKHYLAFGAAVLTGLILSGPEVRERFLTAFLDSKQREASAQSRIDLWADCWDAMQSSPVLGAGPDHWPLIAARYGWPEGKEAHSLWLQTGAELGFPGLLLLAGFYALCMARLWPMRRWSPLEVDPWFPDAARMVITSLAGFMVAAQFVSLEALEIPYYVALVGAATVRCASLAGASGTLTGPEPSDVAGEARDEYALA